MKSLTLLFLTLLHVTLAAQSYSLDEAIRTALENNRKLKISQTAVKIAEAQYQQALSARYPDLTATANATRMDEDPNFKMQGEFVLPQEFTNVMALSGAVSQDEIASMMSGQPSNHAALQSTLNAIQNGTLQTGSIPLDMDVKLMDRDVGVVRLDALYPIYTGGKVSAIIKQAALNKELQSQENRRSEAEVIYDVKRYYYGAMLTRKLAEETHKTFERMNMIQDLTEAFYTGGSLSVKKTDYLRTVVTVSMIESLDAAAQTSYEMAKSALGNAMGLAWDAPVEISKKEFDTPSLEGDLKTLVAKAQRFNPYVNQLRFAIDIRDAQIDEALSGYLPTLALQASAQHIANDYNSGIVDEKNKNSWTIGVSLQWNLFNGWRTAEQVEEARLEKISIKHKQVLLNDGLALQVKHAFLTLDQSDKQYHALSNARDAAMENADLNIRAYQEDIVETKDVIEAQMMETFAIMGYVANLHAFANAQAQLDYIIASQIETQR